MRQFTLLLDREMRNFLSLFGLDRLSVLQRVLSGIGLILLLLVILSIISWQTIRSVETQATYVNYRVTEASAVAQFAARVGDTHSLVTQYALSENDGDLQAAKRALERLQDNMRLVSEAYALAGVSRDSIIDKLRGITDQYRDSVTATIDAINNRRANAAELVSSATELSTTVAAIVEALANDPSSANVLNDAIRLMEKFHSSDASATRFLASRNPADSDTTQVDIAAMRRDLDNLMTRNVTNNRVRRFLNAIAEPFGRYTTALEGLISSTQRFATIATARNTAAAALTEATDEIGLESTEVQLGTVGGMLITVNSARRLGSRLIRSTIRELRPDIQRTNSFVPACHSASQYA